MNAKDFVTYLYPKTLEFQLAYRGLIRPRGPITLTFSVTNLCQSRCKTCQIWRIYPEKHQDPRDELTVQEVRHIFRSMRRVYFFNVSGGEPFLRNDLPEIVEAAVEYLRPAILHAPTNALAPDRIISHTRALGVRVTLVARIHSCTPRPTAVPGPTGYRITFSLR